MGNCIESAIARELRMSDNETSDELVRIEQMRNLAVVAATAALALGTAGVAASSHPPRISKARAQRIALKLAPGSVISSEYEKEGGGWRWSFDIQQKGHVQEIGIDGRTGKVVENKSEGKVDHD